MNNINNLSKTLSFSPAKGGAGGTGPQPLLSSDPVKDFPQSLCDLTQNDSILEDAC